MFTLNNFNPLQEQGENLYDLLSFFEHEIKSQQQAGHFRLSETYASTLRSFRRFIGQDTLAFERLDSDLIASYEGYLRQKGLSPNTTSFYLRNLRALYNRAVDKGLTTQQYPFRRVYTGIDKTVKRALRLEDIRKIKNLDLHDSPGLSFARDMFMFSFYTRGMSFVDMAFLSQKNLHDGFLSYRRRKTGQRLLIRWERCMQQIINRHSRRSDAYLLPIIPADADIKTARQSYLKAASNINRHLKIIGKTLCLPLPLTMYVARHTWASVAKNKNIPISIISEALGHDSETTTQIYLSSLDNISIDNANRQILKML